MMLRIEHIATGSELLNGKTCNTNTQTIGRYLESLGYSLTYSVTVSDDFSELKECLRERLKKADIVIITGGLGPTDDDRTRDLIAELANVSLKLDSESLSTIQTYYEASNRIMPESNRKQAYFPEGSIILPNHLGTAPGFKLKIETATIYALPGVPKEMVPMLEANLDLPLQEKPASECFGFFGLGESAIADKLSEFYPLSEGQEIAYQAKLPEVYVTFYGFDRTVSKHVQNLLGDYLFANNYQKLHEVVAEKLIKKGLTLSVAESFTGGLISHLLTEIPGISSSLLLDTVTYSNNSKQHILGVDPLTLADYGAVSDLCAKEMAEGVARISNADIGLSTTGIAGPDGGSVDKPVGLAFIGIYFQEKTIVKTLQLPGDRSRVKLFGAAWGLMLILDALNVF